MYSQKINNYQLQDHEHVMHTSMAIYLVAKTITTYKRPLTSYPVKEVRIRTSPEARVIFTAFEHNNSIKHASYH